jgi:hypothetical protein
VLADRGVGGHPRMLKHAGSWWSELYFQGLVAAALPREPLAGGKNRRGGASKTFFAPACLAACLSAAGRPRRMRKDSFIDASCSGRTVSPALRFLTLLHCMDPNSIWVLGKDFELVQSADRRFVIPHQAGWSRGFPSDGGVE